MAVVDGKAATPVQRPQVELVGQRSAIRRLREYFRKGLHDWVREFLEYKYLIALSLVLVIVATYLDYYSGVYVSATKAADVPDLILDHLKPIDLNFLFVYGYMALIVTMFLYPLFFHIRMLHVVVCQFSLLLMLRALFLIFTHLQTPAGSVPVDFPWFFGKLYFENDMFFSGHTAIPFLGFYVFRRSPIRYAFLVGSVVMGITALAMHLHYSIDVFSAFFITYCSYQMGSVVIRQIDPAYQDT
ncbi:MAG: hypothetical protein A2Y76_07680 [Planctomycetes bacterium RBG_13_60_9]|nr:MAG: hypothetical protein A2Y76_07680 [Planctomycetes bacterium RBG_13_60_9]